MTQEKRNNTQADESDPAANSGLFSGSTPPKITPNDKPEPSKPVKPTHKHANNAQNDYSNAQTLFDDISHAIGERTPEQNTKLFSLCKQIGRWYKGLYMEAEELRKATARVDQSETAPLTRLELEDIITRKLRDINATGSDVKGLASLMRDLFPAQFADENASRPSPDAVLAYLIGFASREGAEITQELGGSEFIAGRLSELLGQKVIIGG